MSTLGTLAVTLQDWASRLDPNGQIASVIEIMNETNEILDDMPFLEGNLPTGHKLTMRSGIPTSTWRLYNQGVAYTKSKTVQAVETCGMLTQMSKIDEGIAELNGNTAEFRLSEDRPHIEGLSQDAAQSIIYGNTGSDPEEIMGLAPRFNSTSGENGNNIICDASGTGSDNTSIWLVVWGENAAGYGIFPKGSKAGLTVNDMGIQLVNDADGNPYRAYVRHYEWKLGLCIRDWRYVVRICNVDTSELTFNAATGANIIDLIAQALELPPSLTVGTPVIYCNQKIKSFLRRQISTKSNVQLNIEQSFGKTVLTADTVPVRRVDKITNAEATIS